MAVIKVLLFALFALALAEAANAGSLRSDGASGRTQNCECMNWRRCDGEINSDVECHPSYAMVCCIRPKPEPIPDYIPKVIRV